MNIFPNPFSRKKKKGDSLEELQALFTRHAHSFNISARPGFKEALKARILAAREHSFMSQTTNHFFSPFFKKTAPLAFTLVLFLVIGTLVFQPFFQTSIVSAAELTLTPEKSDSLGIDPQSTFLFESKEPLKVESVKNQLTVHTEKNIPFELDQVSSKKIRLAFEEPLPANDIIGFTLTDVEEKEEGQTSSRDYEWAFQVKDTFRIVATTPGNKQTYTPLETGIEITFSHEQVDPRKFE